MTTTTTEDPAAQTAATEDTETPPEPQDADGLMKALRSEREGRKTERKRANTAEAERDELAEKLTAAESKIAKADKTGARALRIAVAVDAGLDSHLAPRLQGTTREELEADARDLVASLDGGGSLDGGARTTAPKNGTPEQEHGKLIADLLNGGDGSDLWGDE